ncbi:MAG: hypothetical protein ACQKBY_05040 [Verrucomicrobiales bacterium]
MILLAYYAFALIFVGQEIFLSRDMPEAHPPRNPRLFLKEDVWRGVVFPGFWSGKGKPGGSPLQTGMLLIRRFFAYQSGVGVADTLASLSIAMRAEPPPRSAN